MPFFICLDWKPGLPMAMQFTSAPANFYSPAQKKMESREEMKVGRCVYDRRDRARCDIPWNTQQHYYIHEGKKQRFGMMGVHAGVT